MSAKHTLPIGFKPPLWTRIKRAAKKEGTTPTEFIREAADEKTEEVLKEPEEESESEG